MKDTSQTLRTVMLANKPIMHIISKHMVLASILTADAGRDGTKRLANTPNIVIRGAWATNGPRSPHPDPPRVVSYCSDDPFE